MTTDEIEVAVDRAMQLVPSEEDGWDDETQPYAEDAAAALAYALRARLTCDPQEAAWECRRVYEAADHFATTGLPIGGSEAERAVGRHSVVQAELCRQRRDLNELSGLVNSAIQNSQIDKMRRRSEQEAQSFFEPHSEVG